jgi:agmatine deiminase
MNSSKISETGFAMSVFGQYRMPAEWAPHAAVWLQWPDESMRDYPGYGVKLESTWLEMTRVMHEHVKVRIIVGSEPHRDRLQLQFRHFGFDSSNIEIFIIPHDDVWARDNGPIFVLDSAGKLAVTSWNFNGWGGRSPSALDTDVAKAAASMLGLPLVTAPFIAEGGAMEVDGQGTFMATRSSILNANRNPKLDLAEAERVFRHLLGVENFIWLSGAPPEVCEKLGDCTDYHIDIAARFTPNGAILYCDANDQSDVRHPYLSRHRAELEGAVNAKGKTFDLIPLPTPKMYSTGKASIGIQNMSDASQKPGRLTDASYTNYLVTNGLVVVPVFGCAEDERAKAILAEHFPGRKVVGIPALSLNEEGGAVHCVTQQQPLV